MTPQDDGPIPPYDAGPFDGVCPLCGRDDLARGWAEQIEYDMKYDERSCIGCGRTFGEAHAECEP